MLRSTFCGLGYPGPKPDKTVLIRDKNPLVETTLDGGLSEKTAVVYETEALPLGSG